LPAAERAQLLATLSPQEAEGLLRDWRGIWARPNQLAPEGAWSVWLVLAGRGFGKTRTSSEWVREGVELRGRRRIALVGRTAADTRDVIVEGSSGILACSPSWNRPQYEPSKRRLTWPNGAIATCYSADEPDLLRGPQHDSAACDELASWKYPRETWSNLQFGLRIGDEPRALITTTPRPIALLRELLAASSTVVTRGSTFDNAVNLAPSALAEFKAKYAGTRMGRQELEGQILDDAPGALWQRDMIDKLRVREAPELVRIVVAIDPAVTSKEGSDETGIGAAGKGVDGHFYVLADRSCRMSPDGWARRAITLLDEVKGDRIVAEVNNGGDLVELTIRTVRPTAPYRAVHASRGKRVRAEPIAALYEQGKVHHVGSMPELEDQMCVFLPEGGDSEDDRVDWLVWSLTDLSEGAPGAGWAEYARSQVEEAGARKTEQLAPAAGVRMTVPPRHASRYSLRDGHVVNVGADAATVDVPGEYVEELARLGFWRT